MSALPPAWQQVDPALLQTHVHDCARSRGPFHSLHCAGEWLHRALAPRLISCLLLLMLGWLLLA